MKDIECMEKPNHILIIFVSIAFWFTMYMTLHYCNVIVVSSTRGSDA